MNWIHPNKGRSAHQEKESTNRGQDGWVQIRSCLVERYVIKLVEFNPDWAGWIHTPLGWRSSVVAARGAKGREKGRDQLASAYCANIGILRAIWFGALWAFPGLVISEKFPTILIAAKIGGPYANVQLSTSSFPNRSHLMPKFWLCIWLWY
jgi:hypothetical protein